MDVTSPVSSRSDISLRRSASQRPGEVHVFRASTGSLELSYPLGGSQIVIGRNADAHICLDHETVSRNHAELICGPFGQWWIHDLESTNGTYVNGSTVQDRVLNPGDEIRVGRYILFLRMPDGRRGIGSPGDAPSPPSSLRASPLGADPLASVPLDQARPSPHVPDADARLRDGGASGSSAAPRGRGAAPRAPMTAPATSFATKEPPPAALGRTYDDDLTTIMRLPEGAPKKISADHLTKTMQLRRKLMGIEDPQKRLTAVCGFIVGGDFPATSATVLRLRDPSAPELLCEPKQPPGAPEPAPLSRSILEYVFNTREPIVATNLADDGAASPKKKLTLPRAVRSLAVVACPLWEAADRVDALYVELPAQYGTEDWRTLMALIADAYRQAEQVWEMRENVRTTAFVERELEMARTIQDGLVPSAEGIRTVDVAIGYEPSRWVGGDYIDAVELPDGRVLLAVADVCGKGLQAALVSSSLHTLVRATLDSVGGLPKLARRTNRYLCSYLPSDSFVTMTTLILDPRTGAVECINAGHPPPLVVHPSGAMRFLQAEENVAYGIMDTEFELERSVLAPGEVLLLYTDGLFELMNPEGEPLGMERFSRGVAEMIKRSDQAPTDHYKQALMRMLENFRGAGLASDDSTFLFARRRPRPAGNGSPRRSKPPPPPPPRPRS
ncbi:MAG: SpoIIE family protein phosphatase [Myxococcota bacterium]